MDIYEKSKSHSKRYKNIKKILKIVYDYDNFKPKQYEIINKIINNEDVCAILPTGYGKSITFQIPALYIDKPAIIISPLISLMDDQRMILDELNITSCCYNSTVKNKIKLKTKILQGKYKFIYITPESIIELKDFFIKLEDIQGISLIAIDEAHCISSYGYDFRKSYRELNFLKIILPEIPILAVTATATEVVGKDICNVLGFKDVIPIKTSFNRQNLYLEVRIKTKKEDDLLPIINKYTNESIIIYCLTRSDTEKIANILTIHGIKCGIYNAGIDVDDKAETHKQFMKGEIKVMVATIAFGMGINKSNVRVIIHYGAPKNIEGYYQEIGRAGRDGENAYCYAFYNYRDFKVQESFIVNGNNEEYNKTQKRMLNEMKNYLLTKQCRRQILLEYFDEYSDDNCNFCDNCLNIHQIIVPKISLTSNQNIEKEAKELINLIESIKNRSFGLTTYIDILRGSNSKKIPLSIKRSEFYSIGKDRSKEWWKEVGEKLIEKNFLQYVSIKGKFMMQVIKVTELGLNWINYAELNGIIDIPNISLENFNMTNTI